MTELAYTEIKEPADVPAAPVYLVHGEEMLCQKACDLVIARLLGGDQAGHRLDRLDGGEGGALSEALARVNTYALLGGTKLVLLADTRVFHDRTDSAALLGRARQALSAGRRPQAAKALLAVLGFHRLPLAEVDAAARRRLLEAAGLDGDDDAWLETLVAWCRDQGLSVPPPEDEAAVLARALEKGFPAGNHLLLTAAGVDRRRKLYKAIAAAGAVVDCSVPTGDRKADREAQQRVLRDEVRRICSARGKRLAPEAFDLLVERTGFDLRTFAGSLQKLVDYTGETREIGAEAVRRVTRRTRKDPIYELTGAAGERHFERALTVLDALLAGGAHPLQVLAALVNHARRLMLARAFLDAPEGRCWRRGMDYGGFQRSVLPAIQEHDRRLAAQVGQWQAEAQEGAEEGRKRRRGIDSDLLLVKNPRSAFPLYKLLQQAEGFGPDELERVFLRLADADRGLKSGEAPARRILESLLWAVCHREGKG